MFIGLKVVPGLRYPMVKVDNTIGIMPGVKLLNINHKPHMRIKETERWLVYFSPLYGVLSGSPSHFTIAWYHLAPSYNL